MQRTGKTNATGYLRSNGSVDASFQCRLRLGVFSSGDKPERGIADSSSIRNPDIRGVRMQNEEPLAVILETLDPTEVAIVKSLLEAAGIPYLTQGEDQYDAF